MLFTRKTQDSPSMKRLLALAAESDIEEPASGGATIAELVKATAEIAENFVPSQDILTRLRQG